MIEANPFDEGRIDFRAIYYIGLSIIMFPLYNYLAGEDRGDESAAEPTVEDQTHPVQSHKRYSQGQVNLTVEIKLHSVILYT